MLRAFETYAVLCIFVAAAAYLMIRWYAILFIAMGIAVFTSSR